jgi:hypothetical protein
MRAMPFSELLDEAFRLYRRHFLAFAGLSLALKAPSLLIDLVSGGYRYGGTFLGAIISSTPRSNPFIYNHLPVVDPLWGYLQGLIAFVLFPLVAAAPIALSIDFALYGRGSVAGALRRVLSRYFAIAIQTLLIGLAVVLMAVLIISIPLAIWAAFRWSVTTPALLAEGARPRAAMARSWRLVKGRWWHTVGIIFVVGLLQFVASFAVGAVLGIFSAITPGVAIAQGVSYLGAQVAQGLVTPLSAIAITLIYFDLRVRKEGFDLDVMAQRAVVEVGKETV